MAEEPRSPWTHGYQPADGFERAVLDSLQHFRDLLEEDREQVRQNTEILNAMREREQRLVERIAEPLALYDAVRPLNPQKWLPLLLEQAAGAAWVRGLGEGRYRGWLYASVVVGAIVPLCSLAVALIALYISLHR